MPLSNHRKETPLSLIGFGFTIFQIFQKMYDGKVLPNMTPARHFGTALMLLGVLMLTAGIGYHQIGPRR